MSFKSLLIDNMVFPDFEPYLSRKPDGWANAKYGVQTSFFESKSTVASAKEGRMLLIRCGGNAESFLACYICTI